MIKKILIWGVLIFVILCVIAYFYFSSELNKSFPGVIDASRDTFIESCNNDETCIQEVTRLYLQCKANYTVKEVSLFTFQEEYTNFLTTVNKCIQEKANVKVPSIWQYMMENRPSE